MSLITFSVVDVSTGEPLSGATVSVNGMAQASTSKSGSVTINAETTDMVTVSFIGYDSFSLMAGMAEDDSQVQLSRTNSSLPAAVVTAKNKEKLDAGTIGLLVIAGLAVVSSGKSRSVSGVTKSDKTMLIIGAVVLGGIYLMTRKTTTPVSYPQTYPAQQPAQYPAPSTPSDLDSWISVAGTLLANIFGSSTSGQSAKSDWSAV